MTNERRRAWDVSRENFPVGGARSEKLEYLVSYAVLAPSTHNTQPWLFRIRDDALEILADRSRALPIADPQGRELTISCGAAVQFAHLAARNFNFEGSVELLPDDAQPDLLARLRLGIANSPSPQEKRRFDAIGRRHTNRTAMRMAPKSQQKMDSLGSLAERHGVAFKATRDAALRRRIANLVADAETSLMDGPEFRRELAHWIKSPKSPGKDGMSLTSFGMSGRLTNAAAAALATVNVGAPTARTHRDLVLHAPTLGILATRADCPKSWLRAGMALADIALEIAAFDLSSSFFSQPLMIPRMRARLADIMGIDAFPQMLFRYGRAAAVPAAARKSAPEVTSIG